jgi:hypothetical protein
MIYEGDMERGSGKPPFSDGKSYPYWKIRMSAHLQGIDWRVWVICEDPNYEMLAAHVVRSRSTNTMQIARLVVLSF